MRKILDLTNKVLRTGRTRSDFMEGGIWNTAQGLNPYLANDTYRGLIAATALPTDLTGSVVVDTPIAYAKDERTSTFDLYIQGASGHLYHKVAANNTITDLRSGTPINGTVAGMGIYKPRAASTPLLYYGRSAAIGTWNLSGTYPTGWTDSAYTPGSTTDIHPFHSFEDRMFYGDGPWVSQFSDDGTSTPVHTTKVLDIAGTETVTALGDDGRYLLIGASNRAQPSLNALPSCRVLFWDGSGSSWDWEIPLPNENMIRGIKRSGSGVYVFGEHGVYSVVFGGSATPVFAHASTEAIPVDPNDYTNRPYAVGGFGDGVLFGAQATAMSKYLPGTDRIAYSPLTGLSGNATLIITDFEKDKVLIGTDTPKLYTFDLTSAGAAPAQTWITRQIPLGGLFDLERIQLTLPNGIGSTDHIYAYVYGTSTNTFVEVTQVTYGNQTFLSLPLPKQIKTTHVKVALNFAAGTPSISDISLWGDAANV